jgi:hypothetical protein
MDPEMEAKTSNLPFVALLSGLQSWDDLAARTCPKYAARIRHSAE